MHSRIFQISKKPISDSDYITASNCYWFCDTIADYVSEETDRIDDIQWLKSVLEGCDIASDTNGEYFVVTDKSKYFEKSYSKFTKTIQELSECNLATFIDGINMDMSILNSAYDDKFGFYIYDSDGNFGVLTLDRFIRECELNTKYYIGKTIDYHF